VNRGGGSGWKMIKDGKSGDSKIDDSKTDVIRKLTLPL
jgi:hypothetical protein